MYEACTDSAATHWGLLESIGSIIAARSDLFGAFTRHLLMFRNTDSSRDQVLWGLGAIATKRPDLVRSTAFYSLFPLVEHPAPLTRGLAVRLFGMINAQEVKSAISELIDDSENLTFYHEGRPINTTVGELAREAITKMGITTNETE
jgi:hypothetical protein